MTRNDAFVFFCTFIGALIAGAIIGFATDDGLPDDASLSAMIFAGIVTVLNAIERNKP